MNLFLPYFQRLKRPGLIAELIACLLIILFVYAAVSKLSDMATFRDTLSRSPLPAASYKMVSWLIPISEILIAFCLLVPALRRWGWYSSLALLTLFTGYLIYVVLFASNIPCSCGGVLQTLSWKEHIIFNLVFMMLSLTGILLYHRDKNRRSAPPP